MTTLIKLKNTANKTASCFYLVDKKSDLKKTGLNKDELAYVKKKHTAKDYFITLNKFDKLLFIQYTDEWVEEHEHQQLELLRVAGSKICGAINAHKYNQVNLVNLSSLHDESLLTVAEGCALSNYQFIRYKSSKEKNTLTEVSVVASKIAAAQITKVNVLCEAVCKARDLVNEPQNTLNAVTFANEMKQMGKASGLKVEVLNKKQIQSLKMGGLLAVNQGSKTPPTFTVMEWKPRGAFNKKPLVLVGKGVVYDTGGLSLKPTANSMDYMKCDMAGGALVAATMYAIAKAKLNVHVIGLVPATDNRPGFNAFAPGDVITMMDGTTVEMLNSDAEGRMILADALHYAKRYKPELTIDLATLTGAAAAAIGSFGIVGMGNAKQKQKDKLYTSGFNVHERIAEFPFWEEYDELIKSDIADQKNLGGPYGGSITAGKFLVKYTDYPYYHLDIAGPAFLTGKDSYRGKGGTGYGVRLLFDFFKNL